MLNEYVEPEALQAQGIQQGRQEGRQEGIQQGRQEMLLSLLRQRFGGEVDAHVEQRVATASGEQLDTWIASLLSAATLSELLGN